MDIEELQKMIDASCQKVFEKFLTAVNELRIEIVATREAHKYDKAKTLWLESAIDKMERMISDLSKKFSNDIRDIHQKMERLFLEAIKKEKESIVNKQVIDASSVVSSTEKKTWGGIIFQPTNLFIGGITLLNIFISNQKAILDFFHSILK